MVTFAGSSSARSLIHDHELWLSPGSLDHRNSSVAVNEQGPKVCFGHCNRIFLTACFLQLLDLETPYICTSYIILRLTLDSFHSTRARSHFEHSYCMFQPKTSAKYLIFKQNFGFLRLRWS